MPKQPLIIRGLQGFGDGIYQRPAVRHACVWAEREGRAVYLETSWPQVYHDLADRYGLKFVWPEESGLRTQRKNVVSLPPGTFCDMPTAGQMVRLKYDDALIRKHACSIPGIFELQMANAIGAEGKPPFCLDLPIRPEWVRDAEALGLPERFALVRPIVLRREWYNPARNCDPAVLQRVADNLADLGLPLVGVADLDERFEWEPPPRLLGVAHKFYRGELAATTILALMAKAVATVGPVGFIVPAGQALRCPTYVLLGGCGQHNGPHVITDPRADLRRFGILAPDPMCMCGKMNDADHACPKHIPPERIDHEFTQWINGLPK